MEIIVFGTEECPSCDTLKNWMKANNIKFNYADAEKAEIAKLLAKLNVRGVPHTIIKVDGEQHQITGFDPVAIKAVIENAKAI